MAEQIIASQGEVLRSVSIEQETLSAILINSLPDAPTGRAGDVAVEMAIAVKNAFSALEKKGAKAISTLTINVEIDTSDALQSIDEFSNAIATRLDSIIANSLQPGGAAWLATRNTNASSR